MKQNEVEIGGEYVAKVSGCLTTVRLNAIRVFPGTIYSRVITFYDVTNLKTNRKATFRSARKFRAPAKGESNVR